MSRSRMKFVLSLVIFLAVGMLTEKAHAQTLEHYIIFNLDGVYADSYNPYSGGTGSPVKPGTSLSGSATLILYNSVNASNVANLVCSVGNQIVLNEPYAPHHGSISYNFTWIAPTKAGNYPAWCYSDLENAPYPYPTEVSTPDIVVPVT